VSTKPIEPLKRPPLIYREVQDAIREYILVNRLQPGAALPAEGDLARQLGVSRNTVREAVRSLESFGVIETKRGSGLYVSNFSFDPILDNLEYGLLSDLSQLSDLLQVRRVLEVGLIETAMSTMTDQIKEEIVKTVDAMGHLAQAGQPFVNEDRRFHRLLFEHIGNNMLVRLLDIFWQGFNKAAHFGDITDDDPVWTYHAHQAVVDAITAGDVARAKVALDEHYAGLERRLKRATNSRAATEKRN
jgi:DNA-binding FadR family transcriptional regulator